MITINHEGGKDVEMQCMYLVQKDFSPQKPRPPFSRGGSEYHDSLKGSDRNKSSPFNAKYEKDKEIQTSG